MYTSCCIVSTLILLRWVNVPYPSIFPLQPAVFKICCTIRGAGVQCEIMSPMTQCTNDDVHVHHVVPNVRPTNEERLASTWHWWVNGINSRFMWFKKSNPATGHPRYCQGISLPWHALTYLYIQVILRMTTGEPMWAPRGGLSGRYFNQNHSKLLNHFKCIGQYYLDLDYLPCRESIERDGRAR